MVSSRGWSSLTFGKGTCRASAQAQVGKKHLGLRKWLQLFGKVIYLLGGGRDDFLKKETFKGEFNYHHSATFPFQ